MTHSSILAATLATTALSVAFAVGCDKAIDDRNNANHSQALADEKIDAANKEADQKIVAAQAEADKKIGEAYAHFMKLREDYRHQTTNNLVELDREVDVLEANSKTATSKAKADLEAHLDRIHTKRTEFASDYKAIEAASAVTWDDTKARLDKEWTELKALVDKA